MLTSGFGWILLAATLYGATHSLLASNQVKTFFDRLLGANATRRYYRLFFVAISGLTFLPFPVLLATLPDSTLYRILSPWVWLTLALQGLALIALLLTVIQTGLLSFVGLRQWIEFHPTQNQPRPEKLATGGFYHWVRHPLYSFSFVILWLAPVMTWNLLALNLGLSAYMLIGAYFLEEPKLVEQFGQDYLRYRARTPMLVPGLYLHIFKKPFTESD